MRSFYEGLIHPSYQYLSISVIHKNSLEFKGVIYENQKKMLTND